MSTQLNELLDNLKIIFQYVELKDKIQKTIKSNNEVIVILKNETEKIKKEYLIQFEEEIKKVLFEKNPIILTDLKNILEKLINFLEYKIIEINKNEIIEEEKKKELEKIEIIEDEKLKSLILKKENYIDECNEYLSDSIDYYLKKICEDDNSILDKIDIPNIISEKNIILKECGINDNCLIFLKKLYNIEIIENKTNKKIKIYEYLNNYKKNITKSSSEELYRNLLFNYKLLNSNNIENEINYYYFNILFSIFYKTNKKICDIQNTEIKKNNSIIKFNQNLTYVLNPDKIDKDYNNKIEEYEKYYNNKIKEIDKDYNNKIEEIDKENMINQFQNEEKEYEKYEKEYEKKIEKEKKEYEKKIEKEKKQHEKEYEKETKSFEYNCIKLFQLFEIDYKIKIPILLFLDSIHDFTSDRINEKNKIHLKYIELYKKSFFDVEEGKKIFSKNCEKTILCNVYMIYKNNEKLNKLPEILYNVLIKLSETDFLYLYISYFFLYKYCNLNNSDKLSLKNYYKINNNINSNIYTILWKNIPYIDKWSVDFSNKYILDVYKKVVLPSSLVDGNKTTSSTFFKDYNIQKNNFILWAGLNFNYMFSNNNCKLTVTTGFVTKELNQSMCINNEINYEINSYCDIDLGYNGKQSSTNFFIKLKNKSMSELQSDPEGLRSEDIIPINENTSKININDIEKIIYSNKTTGPSVNEIFSIIKHLKNDDKIEDLPLSFIDSLFSLKRIGDLGQIVESKLNNIPLYTDDKMEALIGIAFGCSIITSCGNFLIWYDGETDSLKSLLTYDNKFKNKDNCKSFDIKRINSKEYFEELKKIEYFGDIFKMEIKDNKICKKEYCSIN
jgi:hypothetical protein